jgi:hypothetical protein
MFKSVERAKHRQAERRAARGKRGGFGWDVFDTIELILMVIGAVVAGLFVGLLGCGS